MGNNVVTPGTMFQENKLETLSQEYWEYLVDKLKPNEYYDRLIAKGALTHDDVDEIKNVIPPTYRNQARELLRRLHFKDTAAHIILALAIKSKQHHIIQHIEAAEEEKKNEDLGPTAEKPKCMVDRLKTLEDKMMLLFGSDCQETEVDKSPTEEEKKKGTIQLIKEDLQGSIQLAKGDFQDRLPELVSKIDDVHSKVDTLLGKETHEEIDESLQLPNIQDSVNVVMEQAEETARSVKELADDQNKVKEKVKSLEQQIRREDVRRGEYISEVYNLLVKQIRGIYNDVTEKDRNGELTPEMAVTFKGKHALQPCILLVENLYNLRASADVQLDAWKILLLLARSVEVAKFLIKDGQIINSVKKILDNDDRESLTLVTLDLLMMLANYTDKDLYDCFKEHASKLVPRLRMLASKEIVKISHRATGVLLIFESFSIAIKRWDKNPPTDYNPSVLPPVFEEWVRKVQSGNSMQKYAVWTLNNILQNNQTHNDEIAKSYKNKLKDLVTADSVANYGLKRLVNNILDILKENLPTTGHSSGTQ